MERRKVLKSSLAFLGTTTLLTLGYPVSRFINPAKDTTKETKLTIDKDEIPPGTAKEVILNDIPLVVINRRGSGFIVLSRICTHLGCLVGYDKFENKLVCPCHAGVFNLEGKVLSGPASEPLRRYPVTITSKQITVG